MSWSKSTSGSAAEVKEAVKAWEASVAEADRSASEDVARLHAEQVRRCAALASTFADATKDGYGVSVSANGHAHAETTRVVSDQWAVTLSTYKPTQAA